MSADRLAEIKARIEAKLADWPDFFNVRSPLSAAETLRIIEQVEALTAERDALRAVVARVEALAEEWERMAATAIDPDSREWLPACAATLRECLSGWPKMHAALAGSEADTTDTQPTDQEDQS